MSSLDFVFLLFKLLPKTGEGNGSLLTEGKAWMTAKDTWRPFCVRYVYCSASGLDRGRAGLLLSLLSMFFVCRKAGRQRPAGRLLPSVCCLPNDGVLASGGNGSSQHAGRCLPVFLRTENMLSNDNSSPI